MEKVNYDHKKKYSIQELDFIIAHWPTLRMFLFNPPYWNEIEAEMCAVGILTAEVWEIFVVSWWGLAVWKMQC